MLGQPYIKFIHTHYLNGEMYKKILCLKFYLRRVNQQVTGISSYLLFMLELILRKNYVSQLQFEFNEIREEIIFYNKKIQDDLISQFSKIMNNNIKENNFMDYEKQSKLPLTGTSETACEITFNFNKYFEVKPDHKIKINKSFLEWFIGFVEGEGTFVIFKNKVFFGITLDIEDIQILYRIKKELGFGKILIREQSNRRKGIFYVTSEENFLKLIRIFNGNLCYDYKKEQFKIWLEMFNKQYNKNIGFEKRLIKPSLNTAWLSGYIDATGNFLGGVTNSKTSVRSSGLYSFGPKLKETPPQEAGVFPAETPILTFSITQKRCSILKIIKSLFFNGTIKNLHYDKSSGVWELHISSITKLNKLINYLNMNSLKTKKFISFKRWSYIYGLITNKEHLNKEGLNKIKKIGSKY